MHNEYVRSLMAYLNVLAYSTFKFANSRGYDRARHAISVKCVCAAAGEWSALTAEVTLPAVVSKTVSNGVEVAMGTKGCKQEDMLLSLP